jgi:CarD family transcriptional regulator
MQFSVGDKVVHPHHGPGQVVGVEQKEIIEESKRYYVIEIPAQELTIYVPRRKVESVGVRPAMSRDKLARVLDTLRAYAPELPEDHKERQELIWEKLKTGEVLDIAEVVRDLLWHKKRAHLTKKDTDYLDRGRKRLAAEMALVSEMDLDDADKMIDDMLADGMEHEEEQA